MPVTTSHAVSSFTLGPNTSFACPAVTRNSKGKGKSLRETYVVVEHSAEVEQGFEGRTLWAWSTSFERATETPSPEKMTSVFPSRIFEVHAPPWLSPLVILVFSSGDISAVRRDNLNLVEDYTNKSLDHTSMVLKSFVFSEMACCKGTAANVAAVVVTVATSSGSGALSMTLSAFHDDGRLDVDASGVVGLPDITKELSRSAEGTLLIAQTAASFQLDSAKFFRRAHVPSDPLAAGSHGASKPSTMSLLHINTSQVLLASLTKSADLQLLLWDINYQVLLASRSMQLPKSSKSSMASERATVQLLHATPTHVLVSLSYTTKSPEAIQTSLTRASADLLQSTMLLVPFAAPPASSILGVLGRAAIGEEWLAPLRVIGQELISRAEQECLDEMDVALKEGIAAANTTLEAFVKSHDSISDDFLKTSCKRLTAAPMGAVRLTSLENCLEKQLLRQNYASGEHGMLGFFLDCKDWRSVSMAIQRLPDISEDTLVKVLKAVTVEHISQCSMGGIESDVMTIEVPKPETVTSYAGDRPFRGPPTLEKFVGQFLRAPSSPGPLRAALKKHLDIEQVTAILIVLEKFIGREFAAAWAGDGKPGMGKKQRAKLASGRIEALQPPDQLSSSIALVQNLLDTFLLLLLQHPPAHKILAALTAHLNREMDFHHTVVEELRGPLTMFARAGVQAEKPKPSMSGGDSRSYALKKRREARAVREAQVTSYQVETVIF
ncbi:hypothetical protein FRB98_007864 [Tulasnella sp. 332]|nr:hypothetical protein FRB98_007864 [Tulasnella sp. 332]